MSESGRGGPDADRLRLQRAPVGEPHRGAHRHGHEADAAGGARAFEARTRSQATTSRVSCERWMAARFSGDAADGLHAAAPRRHPRRGHPARPRRRGLRDPAGDGRPWRATYVAPPPATRPPSGTTCTPDPLRRKATLQARDSGGIAITSRIALRLDAPHKAGLRVIYLASHTRQASATPGQPPGAVYRVGYRLPARRPDRQHARRGLAGHRAARIYGRPGGAGRAAGCSVRTRYGLQPLPPPTGHQAHRNFQHRWTLQVTDARLEAGQSNKPARFIAGAGSA